MKFIQNLLLKWFGPSFIGRISTSIVSAILVLLAKYGFVIPPEVAAQWSESTQTILAIIFASVVSGGIDLALSRKDKPETPELIQK